MKKTLKIILFPLTFLLATALTAVFVINTICNGGYPESRKVFVSTVLESGQLKFLAGMFLSENEINSAMEDNSRAEVNEEVDPSLITIRKKNVVVDEIHESSGGWTGSEYEEVKDTEYGPVDEDGDGIIRVEISGLRFFGTLLIIEDPSRVSLSTIYKDSGNKWPKNGKTLAEICKAGNFAGGINGGIYDSSNNTGGVPYGVVVSNGIIEKNEPSEYSGLVLIGLTEDDILTIEPLTKENGAKMTRAEVEALVKEKKIRDACCFQEESSDSNNHFVQLVINGKAREMNGMGSGLNPRTVIGQRADGAILMLVTDGRGTNGHLGASAYDVQNILIEYGAVNAANLDGGSSSCMYLFNEYLMDSVTFYYKNSSWKLPLAWVIS